MGIDATNATTYIVARWPFMSCSASAGDVEKLRKDSVLHFARVRQLKLHRFLFNLFSDRHQATCRDMILSDIF